MIDISVTNAFLLYKKIGGTSWQIWFRKNVIRSLRGSQNRPKTATAPVAFKQSKASDLTRLIGQHICVLSQQMHPKQDLAKSVLFVERMEDAGKPVTFVKLAHHSLLSVLQNASNAFIVNMNHRLIVRQIPKRDSYFWSVEQYYIKEAQMKFL